MARAAPKIVSPATTASAPVPRPKAPDPYADGWDFIIASGPVDERLFGLIVEEVTSKKEASKVALYLTTYGGLANAAYRIGRVLQAVYLDVTLVVPSLCKSAGTLVASSANTIVIFPFGELGPLDVQLLKRDELFERRSGLITNYALEELQKHTFELFEHFMLSIKSRGDAISFKMASEIAAKMASDIMNNVYSHINVDAIGEDARNLRVAIEYCQRLNKQFANLKKNSIRALVHGYPSHDFVIDREEALTLFERVGRPTETLMNVFKVHATDLMTPRSNPIAQMVRLQPLALEPSVAASGEQQIASGAANGDETGEANGKT